MNAPDHCPHCGAEIMVQYGRTGMIRYKCLTLVDDKGASRKKDCYQRQIAALTARAEKAEDCRDHGPETLMERFERVFPNLVKDKMPSGIYQSPATQYVWEGYQQGAWLEPNETSAKQDVIVDAREFSSHLEAAKHLLWLIQRFCFYEPEREGAPADGPRFREAIKETRKFLNETGYDV